jgi:hypothetical protein
MGQRGSQRVRFGVPGTADLMATIALGPTARIPSPALNQVVVWVETKSERGRQSREQQIFQRVVENAGHVYLLVHSAAELYDWLRVHRG